MLLLFLRHAEAVDRAPGLADADRRLTAKGERQSRDVARGLAALGLKPAVILSSPWDRARQTAEIVADVLTCREQLFLEEVLACGCRTAALAELLRRRRFPDPCLVVGHEPDLSAMVADIIGGGAVHMRKAAVAAVSTSPDGFFTGCLEWLLTAVQLERIGK
jgi:phosphohistidine phosphatase